MVLWEEMDAFMPSQPIMLIALLGIASSFKRPPYPLPEESCYRVDLPIIRIGIDVRQTNRCSVRNRLPRHFNCIDLIKVTSICRSTPLI